jgi:hypothetical protein
MESVASTSRDRKCKAVVEAVRALGNLEIVFAKAGSGGLTPSAKRFAWVSST